MQDANIDYLQECEYPAEPGPDWEVIKQIQLIHILLDLCQVQIFS